MLPTQSKIPPVPTTNDRDYCEWLLQYYLDYNPFLCAGGANKIPSDPYLHVGPSSKTPGQLWRGAIIDKMVIADWLNAPKETRGAPPGLVGFRDGDELRPCPAYSSAVDHFLFTYETALLERGLLTEDLVKQYHSERLYLFLTQWVEETKGECPISMEWPTTPLLHCYKGEPVAVYEASFIREDTLLNNGLPQSDENSVQPCPDFHTIFFQHYDTQEKRAAKDIDEEEFEEYCKKVLPSPLMAAIEAHDSAKVAHILQENPDLADLPFHEEDTPLTLAAKVNDVEIMAILLAFEADPLAITDSGNTALIAATRHQSREALKALVTHLCTLEPNPYNPSELSSFVDHCDANGQTAVGIAVNLEFVYGLHALRDLKPNADAGRLTPLSECLAEHESLDTLNALLALKPKVDLCSPTIPPPVIMCAIHRPSAVLPLLAAGARGWYEHGDEKDNLLFVLLSSQQEALFAQALTEHPRLAKEKNSQDNTPLEHAIMIDSARALVPLVKHGPENHRFVSINFLVKEGHHQCLEALRSARLPYLENGSPYLTLCESKAHSDELKCTLFNTLLDGFPYSAWHTDEQLLLLLLTQSPMLFDYYLREFSAQFSDEFLPAKVVEEAFKSKQVFVAREVVFFANPHAPVGNTQKTPLATCLAAKSANFLRLAIDCLAAGHLLRNGSSIHFYEPHLVALRNTKQRIELSALLADFDMESDRSIIWIATILLLNGSRREAELAALFNQYALTPELAKEWLKAIEELSTPMQKVLLEGMLTLCYQFKAPEAHRLCLMALKALDLKKPPVTEENALISELRQVHLCAQQTQMPDPVCFLSFDSPEERTRVLDRQSPTPDSVTFSWNAQLKREYLAAHKRAKRHQKSKSSEAKPSARRS